MEKTIYELGPKNTFISIIENYSTDNTKAILEKWKSSLNIRGIKNKIEIGYKENEPRIINRIERLAKIREDTIAPFRQYRNYTHLLFLNDIVYTKQDVITLIQSNNNNYDIVCGMDYLGQGFYDKWVTRDKNGRFVSERYPHFFEKESIRLIKKNLLVPVYSCWNGIVVFKSKLFYDSDVKFRFNSFNEQCYSSECFFIIKDFRKAFNKTLDVYINPKVNVSYRYLEYLIWKSILNSSIPKYLISLFRKGNSQKAKTHDESSLFDCY